MENWRLPTNMGLQIFIFQLRLRFRLLLGWYTLCVFFYFRDEALWCVTHMAQLDKTENVASLLGCFPNSPFTRLEYLGLSTSTVGPLIRDRGREREERQVATSGFKCSCSMTDFIIQFEVALVTLEVQKRSHLKLPSY